MFELRRTPKPPKPDELTVWQPPAVWTHGASRLEVQARRRTFERRAEVERWAEASPDEAPAVLAAWDAWEAACNAEDAAAGVPQAQRREAVLGALHQRAFHRREAARAQLLAHPTFDPAAIRTKLEIIEDAGEPDATTVELANSFLAALGFEERV